jgi:hypothetical protein
VAEGRSGTLRTRKAGDAAVSCRIYASIDLASVFPRRSAGPDDEPDVHGAVARPAAAMDTETYSRTSVGGQRGGPMAWDFETDAEYLEHAAGNQ